MSDERHAGIAIHRITIRGGWGAFALIAVLLTVMLIELEPLRVLIVAAALGVAFGAGLIVWRRRRLDRVPRPRA